MYLATRGLETSRGNRAVKRSYAGDLEAHPYFYRTINYAELPYQKYVKWMYPFESAMCEIIQAEEIAHRISSINKSHDKLTNLYVSNFWNL